jgi:adenine-specific DNA-methyltransferase
MKLEQAALEPEVDANRVYATEGIRYTGSKKALIPQIHAVIRDLGVKDVLDGFSGSTRVSQFLKAAGYNVCANDLADYSRVLGTCYLLNNTVALPAVEEKLRHLNARPPVDGYFTEYYAGDDDGKGRVISADGKKKPFLRKNTRKLDAIRDEIDRIAADEVERCILLTALINGLDLIENTLGHQVAYLSKWAGRSRNDLTLQLPRLLAGTGRYQVLQQDAATIDQGFDLAYFDPPYNTNNPHTPTTRVRYRSYYHFWTTVVRNDRPKVVGASNRRYDASSDTLPGNITPYEHIRPEVVLKEIERLVENVRAKYVLFSYSNKGKIRIADLQDAFRKYGAVTISSINHRENIQRTLTSNNEWLGDRSQNVEYLFLIEKG